MNLKGKEVRNVYTEINFKTKKELKAALSRGEEIRVFQPGPFADKAKTQNGTVCLEGPHFPKPHSWYAEAEVKDGLVVKVR